MNEEFPNMQEMAEENDVYIEGQEIESNIYDQERVITNQNEQEDPKIIINEPRQKPMDQSSILSELNTKLMELPEGQQTDVSLLIHSLMEFYQHHIKK